MPELLELAQVIRSFGIDMAVDYNWIDGEYKVYIDDDIIYENTSFYPTVAYLQGMIKASTLQKNS